MTESTDLTPHEEHAPVESAAVQQRKRMDALVEAVEGRSVQLQTLLSQSGIPFNRFVEIFRRALIKGSDKPETNLLLADAGSVIQACIDACTAGLLPDGKQGAIVIFNANVAARGQAKRWVKKAQFIAMYEGLLHLAYSSGNFTSIAAQVVYEVDQWDYELGINPWVKHKPGKRPPRPEGAPEYEIIAAYAVAKTVNGGVFVEVFEPEDIRKVMAVSKATFGPSKDWREAMVRKGPLRRLYKFLPRNDRMDRALSVDDEAIDVEGFEVAPPAERKLSPGFRPQAALTQGADPVVDIPMDEIRDEEPELVEERPSEVEAKRDMAAETPAETPASESAETNTPENPMAAFKAALEKVTSWLNIKQALKTFAKAPGSDIGYSGACVQAWDRYAEIGDKTEFCADPILFECWFHAIEPDEDAIEANWRILSGTDAFTKAEPSVKHRLMELVERPA